MTYIEGAPLWIMIGLVALTMAIIWCLPKITTAILIVTAIATGLNATVEAGIRESLEGVMAESVTRSAGLPKPFFLDYAFPPLTWETLRIILPFSLVLAAVGLLMFVLFLSPWIEMVPMAALVGLMFMVVSALVFAWQHGRHIVADVISNQYGSKIYQLYGMLFFASVSSFKELFEPQQDPDDVVLDFYYTRIYDQSGLEAIHWLSERYAQHGKRLHLTHLSPDCRRLLERAGDSVVVNLSSDPQYHVVTDRIEGLAEAERLVTRDQTVSPSKA